MTPNEARDLLLNTTDLVRKIADGLSGIDFEQLGRALVEAIQKEAKE